MSDGLAYVVTPVTPFQQNCSLVWCRRTRRGAVIDPGGDLDRIRAAITSQGIEVEQVLLTHAHLDHAGGARVLADELGVPVVGPQREDAFWLDAMPRQSEMFGFPPVAAFRPDRWLEHGESIEVGEQTLQVLHCPGHTPGHVVFFHPHDLAFVGDVLFHGSIGRTDFPRGDHATLLASIRNELWPLGDAVRFVPGHGPESTFGAERRSNPFVADRLFE